ALPPSGMVLSGTLNFRADPLEELFRPAGVDAPARVQWSASWYLSPCECQASVPEIFNQSDPRWRDDQYDNTPNKTMGQKGCAVSSVAMALGAAGVTIDAGALNDTLAQTLYSLEPDFDLNGNVNWTNAIKHAGK